MQQLPAARFNCVIFGIDASLTRTGFAALHFKTGAVKPHAIVVRSLDSVQVVGGARLHALRCNLETLIIDEAAKDSGLMFAVLEGYAYGRGQQREALGEWGGIIKEMLYRHRTPVLIAAPATLKLATTGSGDADKEDMHRAVLTLTGIACGNNDEADAVALAWLGAQRVFGTRPAKASRPPKRLAAIWTPRWLLPSGLALHWQGTPARSRAARA